MAKLHLDIEDIRVDSFVVDQEDEERAGTVEAFAVTGTCQGAYTCAKTCGNLSCDPTYCIASCPDTCKVTCGDCVTVFVCN